jgi:hypothetical protein
MWTFPDFIRASGKRNPQKDNLDSPPDQYAVQWAADAAEYQRGLGIGRMRHQPVLPLGYLTPAAFADVPRGRGQTATACPHGGKMRLRRPANVGFDAIRPVHQGSGVSRICWSQSDAEIKSWNLPTAVVGEKAHGKCRMTGVVNMVLVAR